MRSLRKLLNELLDRLAVWYWRDPVAYERHRIEEEARRFNGRVIWDLGRLKEGKDERTA